MLPFEGPTFIWVVGILLVVALVVVAYRYWQR
jgi:hypothetical protein